MEEKKYEFVHETIKKKPVNKKKLLRRTVLTAALAVVFGLVACVTFLLIEPVINNVLNPEKISKVEFPEEKKEVKPQELLFAFNEEKQTGKTRNDSGGGSQGRSDPVCHDCIWDRSV